MAKKAVGMRATERAIQRGQVKKVFLASDVDEKIQERIISVARERGIAVEFVSSAEELGRVCGIEVASSCAALLESPEENQKK